MNKEPNILICDDNVAVHESLNAYLRMENMNCVSVYDGEAALERLKSEQFDLIVLDVMMPKKFGTDVCRETRKISDVPIIFLSARGDEFDRVMGLELGADDYIVKPFSPREVVARIKTILKRVSPRTEKNNIFQVGKLTIDADGYTVSALDVKLKLTPKEIETLTYLSENKNKVMTREQIINRVWGYDYFGDTRAVDTIVKRIRAKLPANLGFEIKAVYGVGYKLEVFL